MKDAMLKRLRQSYPALAARMPNPPSLEELIAQAEKRLPTVQAPGQSASSAADEFVFAEDRLAELGRLFGIPDGPAVDSYRYLVKGEGSPEPLTLETPKANGRSTWNDSSSTSAPWQQSCLLPHRHTRDASAFWHR
jgi:hypothetical protein